MKSGKQPYYFLRMGDDPLEEAQPYLYKRNATDAYKWAARDLARYGQGLAATLHVACSRDELHEYPDYVLSLNPSGTVHCEAA